MSVKLEHRIGLPVPARAVWAVVADLPHWKDWNPLYPRVEGALKIGAQLSLDLALPGQAVREIKPVILDWVPDEQIHWRLSLLGGLVRTTRYIEIEALGEHNCIFANGELFQGPLGPLVARRMAKPIRAGFKSMGEAVRDRVMATWRPEG